MMKTLNKISFFFLILSFLQSCGYQPLLTDKYQCLNVYLVQKLARTLGNYFGEIEGVENNLTFEITASEKISIRHCG